MIARVKDNMRAISTLLLDTDAVLEQLDTAQNTSAVQTNEEEQPAELEVAHEAGNVETAVGLANAQAGIAGEGQTSETAEIPGNNQSIKVETTNEATRKNLGMVDLTGEEENTATSNIAGGMTTPTTSDPNLRKNDQNVENIGQGQHILQADDSDEIEIVHFRTADQAEMDAAAIPTAEGPNAPEILFISETTKKRKGREAGQTGKRVKVENADEDENASEVTIMGQKNVSDDDFDDAASAFSDDFV